MKILPMLSKTASGVRSVAALARASATPAAAIEMEAEAAKPSADWKKPALAGYVLIILTFGVMGSWAAVAPLDRAVMAPGTVTIENNRKVVQHFEGGIVQEILVQEGQKVAEGAVLFRLQPTQAQANSDLVQNQLDAAFAYRDRLLSELQQSESIEFSEDLQKRASIDAVRRLMDDQVTQFNERRSSLHGQSGLYESKVTQLETEKQGLAVEKASVERQVAYIMEELTGLRSLKKKGLVSTTRVLEMERERTRLEGIIGRGTADASKAENSITEARLEIAQLRQKFQEDVSTQLLDVRQKISDLRERHSVATDILTRQEIRAPRAGIVQSLKVFTVGQVIRSGDPLLEIVPDDEKLVIHAQFAPKEIENLHTGLEAEIRFSSFNSRRMPIILGKLDFLSHDRLIDETTRQPYFLGIISLDKVNLPQEYRDKLVAGLPAEVVIATGERTALNYMIAPLTDQLRNSMRE